MLVHAGDLAVFRTDMESLSEVISLTKSFCVENSASVKWEKSCGFWYGPGDFAPVVCEGASWSCIC